MVYIAWIVAAYLTGSLPVAYILVKAVKGIDVRTVGSGNVGATNAGRAVGRWGFFAVLFLDALKGYIPVYFAIRYCSLNNFDVNLILLVSAAVILGHTFSLFLKFKGGKGVATSLGVFLALAPVPVLLALAVFILVVLISKMISAGSVISAFCLAVFVTLMTSWHGLWYFSYLIAFLVIVNHRTNIRRILSGTENKVNIGK